MPDNLRRPGLRQSPFARALLYGCAAAVMVVPQGCKQARQLVGTAVDQPASAEAGVKLSAESFRILATADVLKGLSTYSTPAANLRFAALGQQMFPQIDWQDGWQLFLSTSLSRVVRADGNSALVAYYHPWSDVLLLTGWRKGEDGKLRVASVDVMLGSVVRGAKPPLSLARAWQTGETFGPEAIATITAQTTQALKAGFAKEGPNPFTRLDGRLRNGMAVLCAVPFDDFRREIMPLFAKDRNNLPILAAWKEVRTSAQSGKTARSGEAGDTIRALHQLDPRLRYSAFPVAYLAGDKASLLIMSPRLDTELLIVLQTTRDAAGNSDIRRVDLLAFESFERAAAKGGSQ